MGLIYCATFKNNKKYVGQTTQALENRIAQHKYWAYNNRDNFLFHKAIRKYGMEEIVWEILEDNLKEEELNEREIYWIRIKESYYIHNKGYNMTVGGNNRKNLRIFSEEQDKQIFEKYKSGASMKEISKEYSCSITAIKNSLKNNEENYSKYSYNGKGTQSFFPEENIEALYKEYQEEGSTQILAQKYNVDITTIERNLSKIDKNYYKNYGWRFKLPRKQSLQMCEDFK